MARVENPMTRKSPLWKRAFLAMRKPLNRTFNGLKRVAQVSWSASLAALHFMRDGLSFVLAGVWITIKSVFRSLINPRVIRFGAAVAIVFLLMFSAFTFGQSQMMTRMAALKTSNGSLQDSIKQLKVDLAVLQDELRARETLSVEVFDLEAGPVSAEGVAHSKPKRRKKKRKKTKYKKAKKLPSDRQEFCPFTTGKCGG